LATSIIYQYVTYFCGVLKSNANAQKPRNIHELKNKIKEEIASTPLEMIHRIVKNCLRRDSHHLDDNIFKN